MSTGNKRGRPTERPRSEISEAVISLRKALGDTQQQFAQRIKTSITTIARWETNRPPSGHVLRVLSRFAHDAGLKEFAEIFGKAYVDESGSERPEDELLRAALYTLAENRGKAWLIAELRSLISDAKKGLELLHPEVFTASMEPNSTVQIQYLQSLLDDLKRAPKTDSEGRK
jgi:transcriptional regulator with XRE-family HTH domain